MYVHFNGVIALQFVVLSSSYVRYIDSSLLADGEGACSTVHSGKDDGTIPCSIDMFAENLMNDLIIIPREN